MQPADHPTTTNSWFLLTNTLLPPDTVVQLYVARWRIETVYRTLQTTGLGLGKHRGNESTIRHVVAAACLEHLLLRARELQATHEARMADAAQHQAWASATSSTHHQAIADTIMQHLPPVRPLRRCPPPLHDPVLRAYSRLTATIAKYTRLFGECQRVLSNLQAHATALAASHPQSATWPPPTQ